MSDVIEVMARAVAAQKCGIVTNHGGNLPDDIWRQGSPIAVAALSALTAAGYAAVPVEPTEAMAKAGGDVRPISLGSYEGIGPWMAKIVYRTMIAAAKEDGK